jgi:hypothetical protein
MFGPDPVLPDGAVLVHVGPFKTGTTSLQTAFDAAAPALSERGIWWASPDRRRIRAAVTTLTGAPNPLGPEVGQRRWRRLKKDVTAAAQRVVISSEFLSEADVAVSRKVVKQLGGARVHIAITLRPLSAVLPSQWQQFAQSNPVEPYEDWLHTTLDAPERAGVFWRRHDHAALVERWAEAAGAENVCVVALDEADRGGLTRSFEHLLGLDAGFLETPHAVANRSLTYGEIELVRRLNQLFSERQWSDYYDALIRHGVTRRMMHNHQPGPNERRIVTPGWALERAREIGHATAERIDQLGVRVIGDPADLAWIPDPAAAANDDAEVYVTVESAFQAILGVIDATRITKSGAPLAALRGQEAVELRRLAAEPLGAASYVDLAEPHVPSVSKQTSDAVDDGSARRGRRRGRRRDN